MNSDHIYFTEKKTILEHLTSGGVQNLKPVIEALLNEAMKIEREEALKAAPYERNPDRAGYANGFKERDYTSRLGALRIQIPQVRGLSFYPRSLEKGERSERARKLVLAFSQDLLDRVNISEEIRPHLVNYSFLPKNLSYGLTIVNKEGRFMKNSGSLRDPDNLASCSMLGGKILYSILNDDKISLQVIHSETYEEALEIVNRQGGLTLNDMWH